MQLPDASIELRNMFVTNRVSLYVDYYMFAPSPDVMNQWFGTLDASVRKLVAPLFPQPP